MYTLEFAYHFLENSRENNKTIPLAKPFTSFYSFYNNLYLGKTKITESKIFLFIDQRF